MASPKGCDMSEITAIVWRFASFPMRTIVSANRRALARSFIKVPSPVVTSKTIASAPAAIFLLIMELAINGIESTVAVTSRNA